MATSFVIACPECGKQVKASEEHIGKKIKCKECSTVYPVKAPEQKKAGPPPTPGKKGPPPAPGKKGPPPTPAAESEPIAMAPVTKRPYEDDDDDGIKEYGLIEDDGGIARCPRCAKEMPSQEALVCLNCGFNVRTRTRAEVETVYENTTGDVFKFRLPAFLSIITIIGFIIWTLILFMKVDSWLVDSFLEDTPGKYYGNVGPSFFKTMNCIGLAFLTVPLVRIIHKKLIKESRPKERRIKDE